MVSEKICFLKTIMSTSRVTYSIHGTPNFSTNFHVESVLPYKNKIKVLCNFPIFRLEGHFERKYKEK